MATEAPPSRGGHDWDAAAYGRFGDERTRPFHDLLARVPATDPRLVVDLGCGNGPATLTLAERWPSARIVGVDSSVSMLDSARALDGDQRIEWVQADLTRWDPATLGGPADVIVTNAALQWIPAHVDLIAGFVGALRPGGWFAMQVPGNFAAPSHALMREVAAGHPRAQALLAALELPASLDPPAYLDALAALGCRVDVWESTYLHVLDPGGTAATPVLDWVRSTGLRPVLAVLQDDRERADFLDGYAAALATAYPRTEVGVVLPFRRIFAVAQRPGR